MAAQIAATDEWLKQASDSNYFIQLFSTDGSKPQEIEAFLKNNASLLDPAQIRVYRSKLSGRERLGVIYGDYPLRETAVAELGKLGRLNALDKPYLRTVRRMR